MKCWRVLLAIMFCISPLYLVAVDKHLAHRMIWAIVGMDFSLFGVMLAQRDGEKRSHKESRNV